MAGLIYCFNTVGDNKIYKAGHTQNSLSTRLKGYLGPSKPRTIFFSRKVDDSIHAEKMMLTLLRQCTSLKEREDLGDEWFENVSEDSNLLYKHLQNIADIVQLASRTSSSEKPAPIQKVYEDKTPLEETNVSISTNLKGMEQYFQAFDTFVNDTSLNLSNSEDLVNDYEESNVCPVFADYVPYTKKQRVCAASHRYSHLFQ